MKKVSIFLTNLLFLFSVTSSAAVFPGASWTETSPESQGMDSGKLQQAMDYLKSKCGSQGTSQAVVIRNGTMVWKGSDIHNQHNVWSCTKSFTSTVLGLLVDDAKCSLETKAKDYLPSLAANYSGVTLRHFATMTSGYNAVGGNGSSTPFKPAAPLFGPGEKFQYWDSAMNQFANTLTRIAGEPIAELFKRRIADPIQMDSGKWKWGDWGIIDGILVNGGAGNHSKGIHISAAEMARFGLLFLNKGKWNGKQLISQDWVEKATSAQDGKSVPVNTAGKKGPGVYGFNWSLNGILPDGKRRWPLAPKGTYAATGHNNNKCFVVPEWEMVIVRLGTDGNTLDNSEISTFFGKLGDAIVRR